MPYVAASKNKLMGAVKSALNEETLLIKVCTVYIWRDLATDSDRFFVILTVLSCMEMFFYQV